VETCYTVTAAQTDAVVQVRVLASTSDPLQGIPSHERWLWQNVESMESFKRAKEDVRAGRVHELGSFSQYIDIDTDD
jgi:hypothetical protein